MDNNFSRVEKTIATGVELNLGGGASALVDLHVSEEGFLLIDGLGLDKFDYVFNWHKDDKGDNRVELQILFPIG
ncbi:hypothetical protein [Bacillus subtilis]|uniref:hypothetical protein n=1 Tax=Bacillus subtilis TaxID=1423 RepID=UPI001CFBA4FA|nr:hypothetical protein [Bacillus subtilis]MCB4338854.1 hypothetical protein [Bacillus subtilis]